MTDDPLWYDREDFLKALGLAALIFMGVLAAIVICLVVLMALFRLIRIGTDLAFRDVEAERSPPANNHPR